MGDIISIEAKIIRAFNTSMEIFVQAYTSNVLVGTKYLIGKAYFNFLALDNDGKANTVIPVLPASTVEKNKLQKLKEDGKSGRYLKTNNHD